MLTTFILFNVLFKKTIKENEEEPLEKLAFLEPGMFYGFLRGFAPEPK